MMSCTKCGEPAQKLLLCNNCRIEGDPRALDTPISHKNCPICHPENDAVICDSSEPHVCFEGNPECKSIRQADSELGLGDGGSAPMRAPSPTLTSTHDEVE